MDNKLVTMVDDLIDIFAYRNTPCICICDKPLRVYKAIDVYKGNVVQCDACCMTINNKSLVYHCINHINVAHPNGFNVCSYCVQRPRYILFKEGSGNQYFFTMLKIENKIETLIENNMTNQHELNLLQTQFDEWISKAKQKWNVSNNVSIPTRINNLIFRNKCMYQNDETVQIMNICVCDEILNKTFAKNVYSGNGVKCDGCTCVIKNEGIIYHCPRNMNVSHPGGYDLCEKCFAMLSDKYHTSENISKFTPHMTVVEAAKLTINDSIDFRHQFGRFITANILTVKNTEVKIHYEGYDEKYDIWCDYTKEINRFAANESITKRKASICKQLKFGDYVDVNPSYVGHSGWRCGKITCLDKKWSQICVGYKHKGKTESFWTHVDNILEITPAGTKCDPVTMLLDHFYEPFLLSPNEADNGFNSIYQRLKQCMKCIKTDIIPQKTNAGKSALLEYLHAMRRNLLQNLINCRIKLLVNNESLFSKLENEFELTYIPIFDELKLETDHFHLNISKDILKLFGDNDSKIIQVPKEYQNIMRQIKMEWNILNDEQYYLDQCDIYECSSIKRMNYLLQIFDVHFIQFQKAHDNIENEEKKQIETNNMSMITLIYIYDICINDNQQYPQFMLINDTPLQRTSVTI
eukprot:115653_1